MAENRKSVKPDILLPYLSEKATSSSLSVICVRPETNKIDYESIIIKAVAPLAEGVYIANLGGEIINKKGIVMGHYSSQFQFAISGKSEIAKYPEMVTKFEDKFNVDFADAEIIGAYEALLDYGDEIGKDADELFGTIVPEHDFLTLYGQSIKKIAGYYVVNYDIPGIVGKYGPGTNIFVIGLQLKNKNTSFSELNRAIYQGFEDNKTIDILDSEKRKDMKWFDQVRRTYHISGNHIQAMFDITDYIFTDDNTPASFYETPLGQMLCRQGFFDRELLEKRLLLLKEQPLVYLNRDNNQPELVNIIKEGRFVKNGVYRERTLEECCEIIKNVDWQKSFPAIG